MQSLQNSPKVHQISPQFWTLTGIRYRGETMQKLDGFPDHSRFHEGTFKFKNSYANIRYLVENFVGIIWDALSRQKMEEWQKFIIREQSNRSKKENALKEKPVDMGDLVSKTSPFDHQLHAFNLSKDRDEYGLLFEQGCGKTKVIIDNARYLFDRDKIEMLIIIAPNGVHDNWVEEDGECDVHLAGKWDGMAWRAGMGKRKKAQWDYIKESPNLRVMAFNVEAFVSKKAQAEIISMLKTYKCMLCVDESQKIKNPSAKRTKFIVSLGQLKGAAYRRLCTGTPVTRGSEDFYSQLKFLSPNILGITAYKGFKNRYCDMGGYEGRVIVGYRNIDELQQKVDDYTMRVLKKDCLDLPEKLYQFSNFDLTPKQLELVKQIKKDGIAEIKDMQGRVSNEFLLEYAISRMTKIQQVSNGYYYDTENKKVIELVPLDRNPRLNKLKEDLSSIPDEKAIIWCRYTEDIKIIGKLLTKMGKSFVVYDGSISQDQRKENKAEFQHKDAQYFLGNMQAGATGLTLTAASYTFYYTDSYDLELRLQSEDRNHRIGTTKNVLYTSLIANNTPEKKVIAALKKKKSISDLILKDPVGFFLEEK